MYFKNHLIIFFAILSITIGQSVDIYLPSMPSMVTVFHTSQALIQLSVTIGLIGYGSVALIYGPMSDHFGRRIIALVGLGVFISGSILCVVATNIYILLIGRALQGAGYASASGVAAPAVCDVYSGQELVKVFSYVGMAMALVPIIAPLLGGYLQHYFNWQAPFIFLLVYGVSLFILFYKYFPETNKSIKQGNIHPLHIVKTYLGIIKHPRYLGFIFCSVFIFCGEISYVITAPFLFQTKLGLSAIQNGWLIIVTVAGFSCGSFSSKLLCKKFNVVMLSVLGSVAAISGAFAMLLLALFFPMSVITIILPMIFFMYGVGLVYPNTGVGCMECFPQQTGSVASLGGMLSLGIGGVITSTVANLHIDSQLSLACVLLVLAVISLLALLLLLVKKNKIKAEPKN
ncbi:MAG: multidrug effflux MFS transporter [Gammaproteobacteria bacterium]|nr:multidrug effflux MFS transporter [Gammaproteobacteria bacterium]